MPKLRKNQVCLDSTPYYHSISPLCCVRRAFLCGKDEFSGQSYKYRKQWAVDKLAELTGVFSIEVCAYAVIGNHYHLVLHINQPHAETVIERWPLLFKVPMLIDRIRKGERLVKAEKKLIAGLMQRWRSHLTDLGWFMRCLNKSFARHRPTKETIAQDDSGKGATKASLLDEQALLTCMSYVNLNPIRAGIIQLRKPQTTHRFRRGYRHINLRLDMIKPGLFPMVYPPPIIDRIVVFSGDGITKAIECVFSEKFFLIFRRTIIMGNSVYLLFYLV